MSIFSTPFFSIAGQKERLQNVGATLKAAVTGKGVTSNTGNRTVDKVLGAAASNPFVTAGIGAVAAGPSAALGAAKAGFGALPLSGKAAVVIGAPVVVGAVAQNPDLIRQSGRAPAELSQFGADLGGLIAEPSLDNAKDLLRESPIIAGGLALAGVAAVGGGVLGAVSSARNTAALQDINESLSTLPATGAGALPIAPEATGPQSQASSTPLTPQTQVIGKEVSSGTKRKRKPRKPPQPIRNTVRVQVLNQNNYIDDD